MNTRSIVSRFLLSATLLCMLLPSVLGCGDDGYELNPREEYILNKVNGLIGEELTAENLDKHLLETVECGYEKALTRLIEKGADINQAYWNESGIDKNTLLHIAVEKRQKDIAEILIEKGVDVDIKNISKQTPLHIAAENNLYQMAALLIENGADINLRDKNGDSALHLAVRAGNTEVAELLIGNRIYINIKNGSGETPLHYAVRKGNKKIVELLVVNGADADIKDNIGKSALLYAIKKMDKGITKMLIDKKADVNILGWDPLHKAVWEGDKEAVIKIIKKGTDINIKDGFDFTPLYYAILTDNKEITEILIKHGADLNGEFVKAVETEDLIKVKKFIELGADVNVKFSITYTIKGYEDITALFRAVSCSNLKMINILIEAGADVNAKHKSGKTPLFYVNNNNLKGKQIIDILCKAGADLNIQDEYGLTALMSEARSNYYDSYNDIIVLLIQAGADVNIRSKGGKTALDYYLSSSFCFGPMGIPDININFDILRMFIQAGSSADMHLNGAQVYFIEAARKDEKEILQYFIRKGIDINKKDSLWHTTALIAAAEKGHIEAGKLLIAKGANVNITNEYGATALIYAVCNGPAEFVKLLIEAGADKNIENQYGKKAIDYANERGYDKIVALLEKVGGK
jgi:ankyrin repeat protein